MGSMNQSFMGQQAIGGPMGMSGMMQTQPNRGGQQGYVTGVDPFSTLGTTNMGSGSRGAPKR